MSSCQFQATSTHNVEVYKRIPYLTELNSNLDKSYLRNIIIRLETENSVHLRDYVRQSAAAADVPRGGGVEEGVLGGEAGHGLVRRPLLLAPRDGAAVPDGATESWKALSIVMQSSILRFEGGR